MNYTLNPKVDLYLADGCGRCKYYSTPQCKVNKWIPELVALRQIVLETRLIEEVKWSVPVYTHNGKNIVNISAFKDYACISFFKGNLINDIHHVFEKHGENSQAFTIIKFTNTLSITKMESIIKSYIKEAVALEESGNKVVFKKNLEPLPVELETKFKEFPVLEKSFFALTPGRQRGYIIYFSQPKLSQTRDTRIMKYMDMILAGKGINDDYKNKK